MESQLSVPGYHHRSIAGMQVCQFMNAHRWKRFVLLAIATTMVFAACCWMNSLIHVSHENGLVFATGYHSNPVRLSRTCGWPRAVWIRTNWATIANGDYRIDEHMRPKESSFDLLGLTANIAAMVFLATATCVVVSAVFDRRFCVRSLLLLVLCIASLIVLFKPRPSQSKEFAPTEIGSRIDFDGKVVAEPWDREF